MHVTIHRGSNEIGGTCIQLTTSTTTILVDAGSPLAHDSVSLSISSISADAVLISHPHQDHYGMIEQLDPKIPVYIGETGRSLIDAARIFRGVPPLSGSYVPIRHLRPFAVGDITVTPYLVDHSAIDAFAFLIEGDGKRVFYSGDFRGHGRKGVLFDRMIQDPPRDIDLLFMEGTMMHRDNDQFPTEEAVEDCIAEVLKGQEGDCFLLASSQNIDRIVSAYRSCLRTGKELVVDLYSAWVLEQVKNVSASVPNIDWDRIRVHVTFAQYRRIREHESYFGPFAKRIWGKRIENPEMDHRRGDFLYLGKLSSFNRIRYSMKQGRVSVIYSQWLGYLKEDENSQYGAREIAGMRNDPNVDFVYAHTSGHATVSDLKLYANAINPGMIIPIHTEHAEAFREQFSNVHLLPDGQIMQVS